MELVFLLSQSLLFHFRIVFRWLTSWFGAACMGGSIGARLCVCSCMRAPGADLGGGVQGVRTPPFLYEE